MQNNEIIVIGIDVSKRTLDVCIKRNESLTSLVIANEKTAVTKFIKNQLKENDVNMIQLGLENTGVYNYVLYEVLRKFGISTYVFHPLDLARSIGMVRGKNDKIDAIRIANYLALHLDVLNPSKLPDKAHSILKALFSKRKKLVEQRAALKKSNQELERIFGKKDAQTILKSDSQVITALDQAIKQLDKKIVEFNNQDPVIAQHMENIRSVQGVGQVLAAYVAIKTRGFTELTNPRKLACYAGVVPFDNRSGTSLYKKPRVSSMADKEFKRLLHMAALRSIQLPGELQDYYLRKVSEGKNKMVVINAIRNKIIARICSCINNKKKYQGNLVLS